MEFREICTVFILKTSLDYVSSIHIVPFFHGKVNSLRNKIAVKKENKKRTAALHNLGCKVNAYETESMQQMLEQAGYKIVDFADIADVYIINTCSVTNMADRKSRQMIHRAKGKNEQAVIVAAGCYVQTAG